jgi:hypothetical protein
MTLAFSDQIVSIQASNVLLRRVDRPRSAKGGANLKAQQHSNLV